MFDFADVGCARTERRSQLLSDVGRAEEPERWGRGLNGCCGPEPIDSQGTRHSPPIPRRGVCHRYDAMHMPVANIALAAGHQSLFPPTKHTHTRTRAHSRVLQRRSGALLYYNTDGCARTTGMENDVD